MIVNLSRFEYFKRNGLLLVLLLSEMFFTLSAQRRVIVSEIFYDTPLNEATFTIVEGKRVGNRIHHNGEYCELVNCMDTPTDIGGWVLDNYGGRYVFPENTTIEPHGTLLVAYRNDPSFLLSSLFPSLSGSEGKIIYQNSLFWRNRHNSFSLLDARGKEVDFAFYLPIHSSNSERVKTAVNGNTEIGSCLSLHRTEQNDPQRGGLYRSGVPSPNIHAAGGEYPYLELVQRLPQVVQVSDKSRSVTSMPVSSSVSSSGGAIVDFPLQFPEGVPGFAPRLTIRYNSQGGIGALGVGTEMSGLSSITLASRTLYQDGIRSVPSAEGPFALDGIRLLEDESNPRLFKTETFSELSIERLTDGGFRVSTPLGVVSEYGTTLDSRILNSRQAIVSYRISKQIDPYGNTILYTYEGNYIRQIEYGGTNTLSSTVFLTFDYELNTLMPQTVTIAGGTITFDKKLSSISVLYGGYSNCKYRFEYNRSRLTSVKEFSIDGAVRSTELGWGSEHQQEYRLSSTNIPFSGTPIQYGDFNGDGCSDIVFYDDVRCNIEIVTFRGNMRTVIGSYRLPLVANEDNNQVKSIIAGSLFMDLDNNGCQDLVLYLFDEKKEIRSSVVSCLKYNSERESSVEQHTLFDFRMLPGFYGPHEVKMSPLVSLNKEGNDILFAFSDKSYCVYDVKNKTLTGRSFLISEEEKLAEMSVIDMYSNGTNQLLWKSENSHWFISSLQDGSLLKSFDGEYTVSSVIDIDEDGQLDLIFVAKNRDVFCFRNDGGYSQSEKLEIGSTYFNSLDKISSGRHENKGVTILQLALMDFDLDGERELLMTFVNDYIPGAYIFKRGSSLAQWNTVFDLRMTKFDPSFPMSIGSFFSPDKVDLLNIRPAWQDIPSIIYYTSQCSFTSPTLNQLASLNQNGIKLAEFSYQTVSVSSDLSERKNPLADCMILRSPIVAVKAHFGLNEMGTFSTRTYNFKKGIVHTRGVGFIGFSEINYSDNILGSYSTRNNYELNTIPYLKEQLIATPFQTVRQQFEWVRMAESSPFVYTSRLKLQEGTNLADRIRQATNYQYDQQNRLVEEVATLSDNSMSRRQLLEMNAKGLPGRIVETTQTTGSPLFSQTTRIEYTPEGALQSKMERAQTETPITTFFEYNDRGLPTRKTRSAPGVESILEEYEYDSSTLRLISQTKPLSSTSYQYDPLAGWLLRKQEAVGPHLFTTQYQYDSWGRSVYERDPFGRETRTTWAWGNEGGKATALYHSVRRTSGQADQVQAYDHYGREIYSSSTVGDVKAGLYNVYDSRGRVTQKISSHPYQEQWKETVYDSFNRPINSFYHTDASDIFRHNGSASTRENSAGRTYQSLFNAQGGLIRSSEPEQGSVTHRYHSSGQVESSLPAGSSEVKVEYDLMGRRVRLVDPNAGEVRTEYDAYDRVTRYESPTASYSQAYDDYGRLSRVRYDSGETLVYFYVDSGNGYGQLAEIAHSNGNRELYTYDDRSLLSQKQVITSAGTEREYTYSYSTYGDLLSETQSGLSQPIRYGYNDRGELTAVSYGSVRIWERMEEKPGYRSRARLGNGLISQILTRDRGARHSLSLFRDDQLLWSQSYDLDLHTGNVMKRREEYGGQTQQESFTYDGQDRLTSMTLGDEGPVTMEYEPNGRIRRKSDMGDYSYDSSRPHAITSLNAMSALASSQEPHRITYNYLRKIASIEQGVYRQTFEYGTGGERSSSELYRDGVLERLMEYSDHYEKVTDEAGRSIEYFYLCSTPEVEILSVKRDGAEELYYIQKDLVGSWVLLSNARGEVIDHHSFDAWGKRRCGETCDSFALFRRGYGGHEEMPEFGLINMNGRVYDPLLAMFLSPDPYIQSPDFSQNYNRYGYCLNNPFKYTDPSGEFIWIIPSIGWSRSGGLNIGLSVVVGIPGVFSAQAGVGYSFGSNDASVYIGATAAMNTIYASYSTQSGFSVGYTAGLSLYSGLPFNTNFGTIGVNYNISNKSWSGNLSAWQVDKNGWFFNPSFSTMVYPEETTNFFRGKGFRDNNEVLRRFVAAGDQQGALDYWGFKGKYVPTNRSKHYDTEDYWGSANTATGDISYGNLAFSDYETLLSVYTKERFHSANIRSKEGISKVPKEIQGIGLDTYMEEIRGYIHTYKNQGMFPNTRMPFQGIEFYQSILRKLDVNVPTYPKNLRFLYRVPRKW